MGSIWCRLGSTGGHPEVNTGSARGQPAPPYLDAVWNQRAPHVVRRAERVDAVVENLLRGALAEVRDVRRGRRAGVRCRGGGRSLRLRVGEQVE